MGIVHFLNVNEGDCIWIEHPSEHNTIIDISNGQGVTNIFESASLSGNHNQKNYPVNPIEYLKDRNVSTIFRFILTPGAVIRGSTSHYDYVCSEVSKGIAQISLKTDIPIMFGVLTTDTIEQAIERAGTKAGNWSYVKKKYKLNITNFLYA